MRDIRNIDLKMIVMSSRSLELISFLLRLDWYARPCCPALRARAAIRGMHEARPNYSRAAQNGER